MNINQSFKKVLSQRIEMFEDDTEIIDLSEQNIIEISPVLSKFNNLKVLFCVNNLLTTIPVIPSLKELFCSGNKLIKISVLPKLEKLICFNNRLTVIPELPNLKILKCSHNRLKTIQHLPNLQKLICDHNQLTTIPVLPKLKELFCDHNKLTTIPVLPNLEQISYHANPIYDILIENEENKYDINIFHKNNVRLNNFRHMFYSLKYKKRLIKWLWGKSRNARMEQMYHPSNLIKLMETSENWEEETDKW